MSSLPQDLIPTTSGSTPPAGRGSAPARRGGKRPGAGAKAGNLNALKHGRYSRFKDTLPLPPLDPTAVARRVLLREQREVERIAASFLRVLLDARHQRDRADALAQGRPLPPPPLVTPTDADLKRVLLYLRGMSEQAQAEHGRTLGVVADQPAHLRARRWAATLERLMPPVVAALDRAARPTFSAASLAALLPLPRNDQPNGQSAPSSPSTHPEPASPPRKRIERSSAAADSRKVHTDTSQPAPGAQDAQSTPLVIPLESNMGGVTQTGPRHPEEAQ